MTPGLQGAENGPMSAYFPDHPLIPKNTCPEGAKTPRVKLIGEVGPLPPFLAWTISTFNFAFHIKIQIVVIVQARKGVMVRPLRSISL